MAGWKDYLKLMTGLTHTLEELTQVEQDKNDAASQGNLIAVEECMRSGIRYLPNWDFRGSR